MGKYKDIYDSLHNSNSTTTNSGSSIDKQISNYNARLEAAGVDPSKATDSRNWFERATNLPEGQNAFFDLLELINRPQNALFTGIKNSGTGEGTFWGGVKSGFSGKETTTGKDLIKSLDPGVSDKTLEQAREEGKSGIGAILSSIDPVDIAGLGLDIFADPIDYIPGVNLASLGKVKKATNSSQTVSDIKKAVFKINDAARAANEASDIAKTTNKVSNVANVLNDIPVIAKKSDNVIKDIAKSDNLLKKPEVKIGDAINNIDKTINISKPTETVKEAIKGAEDVIEAVDTAKSVTKKASKTKKYKYTIEDYINNLHKPNGEKLPLSKMREDMSEIDIKAITKYEDALKKGGSPILKDERRRAKIEKDIIEETKALREAAPVEELVKAENKAKKTAEELKKENVKENILGSIAAMKAEKGIKQVDNIADVAKKVDEPVSNVADVVKETTKKTEDVVEKVVEETPKKANKASKATKKSEVVNQPIDLNDLLNSIKEEKTIPGRFEKSSSRRFYEVPYQTLSDMLGQGLGMGVKGTLKLTDKAIEGGLGAIDNARGIKYNIKDAKYADTMGKFADHRETLLNSILGNDNGLLQNYKGIKNAVENGFSTKRIELEKALHKELGMREAKAQALLGSDLKKLKENMISVAGKKLGIPDLSSEALTQLKKSNPEKYNELTNFIKELDEGLNIVVDSRNEKTAFKNLLHIMNEDGIKYNEEHLKDIKKALRDLAKDDPDNYKKLINGITIDDGKIKLSDDWISKEQLSRFSEEKLANQMSRPLKYTDDQFKKLSKYRDFFYKDEDGKALLEQYNNFYKKSNSYLESEFNMAKGLTENFKNFDDSYAMHKVKTNYNNNVRKLVEYGAKPEDIEKFLSNNTNANKSLNTRKFKKTILEVNNYNKETLKGLEGLTEEGKAFIDKNIDLFDTLATESIGKYIETIPRAMSNIQYVDEVLTKSAFGNIEEIDKLGRVLSTFDDASKNSDAYKKLVSRYNKVLDSSPFRIIKEGEKAPIGFTSLDSPVIRNVKKSKNAKNLANNTTVKESLIMSLNSLYKRTKNAELKKVVNQLEKLDNKNIVIDNNLIRLLNLQNSSQTSDFFKMYDNILGEFKANKTTSVINQANNYLGNQENMWLSGIDNISIEKYKRKANKDLLKYGDNFLDFEGNYTKLANRIQQGLATKEDYELWDNLNSFMENVSLLDRKSILEKYDIDNVVNGVTNAKNPLSKIREASFKLNSSADVMFKYATYNYALEHPKYLDSLGIPLKDSTGKLLTKEQRAGKAVSLVLFDPEDLTSFEKTWMKRVIPFYTFTKKNLAYQAGNVSRNLTSYKRNVKAIKRLSENIIGEEGYQNEKDYIKDNLYIPYVKLFGSEQKPGDYSVLKIQSPIGDLVDAISNPVTTLANKTNGLIKTPFEIASGKDLFTGQDIESGWKQASNNIIGLDAPARTVRAMTKDINEMSQGNGAPFRNMLQLTNNVNTDKLNKQYRDLETLKQTISDYKKKGYTINTITELREANKNGTVENINSIFSKYGIK